MEEKQLVYTYAELDRAVALLREQLPHCKLFAFSGSLGAGKTTLIRELLRTCGVTEPITSPTFNYVNTYKNGRGETFYHFDLYRIGSVEEFRAQGFDECLHEDRSWSLIEWPEVIMPLLTENVCFVELEHQPDQETRALILRCVGSK